MENTHEENKSGESTPLEKTASDGKEPNVGSGPVQSDRINNGGGGEARQPKEHTGKETDMGGATGGTPGLRDRSEGNDNTSRE